MDYDLRIGKGGKRIVIWPSNEDEERFLGGFTGDATIKRIYKGHESYGRVKELIIVFHNAQEEMG